MITVLHICSDYSKQKLYKKLILSLSEIGVNQVVLVPVRTKAEIGSFDIIDNPRVKVIYAHILKKYHRLFYFLKIKRVFQFIIDNKLTAGVNIVHSHFLFSDGGVGYFLNKKLHIPFITAVRNTDINIFWKYLFFYRFFARKIVYSTGKLIFLSPSYSNQVKWRPYNSKILVIPNGISDSWLNSIPSKKNNKIKFRFLYVGSFLKNKRVPLLIKWVTKLNKKIDCSLTLVGKGGEDEKKIFNFLNYNSNDFLHYLGQINDEEELRKVYNEHDSLVLISKFETFGLVCIEALSQGLPIIYTSGQGVDGFFPKGEFAFPISNDSYVEFEEAVLTIHRSKCQININAIEASKTFNWKSIASNYLDIYKEILGRT